MVVFEKTINTSGSILNVLMSKEYIGTEELNSASRDRNQLGINIEAKDHVLIDKILSESLLMDDNSGIAIAQVAINIQTTNTLAADTATKIPTYNDMSLQDNLLVDNEQIPFTKIINSTQLSSSMTVQEEISSPKLVVLVNSLGRGGSTFVADILKTFGENTFYMFEPLIQLQTANMKINEKSSFKVLDYTLSCKYNELAKLAPIRPLMKHHLGRICSNPNCVRDLCLHADLRLVKVFIYFIF